MPATPLPTLAPPAPRTRRVQVCKTWDVAVGLGRAFRIGGHTVGVFQTRTGRFFAVENTCPHKGGPLSEGMIVGEQVVCPLHAFRFEADTGDCDQPGVCSVAAFPVDIAGDAVFVTVPTT